jgi:hypothetical protein
VSIEVANLSQKPENGNAMDLQVLEADRSYALRYEEFRRDIVYGDTAEYRRKKPGGKNRVA